MPNSWGFLDPFQPNGILCQRYFQLISDMSGRDVTGWRFHPTPFSEKEKKSGCGKVGQQIPHVELPPPVGNAKKKHKRKSERFICLFAFICLRFYVRVTTNRNQAHKTFQQNVCLATSNNIHPTIHWNHQKKKKELVVLVVVLVSWNGWIPQVSVSGSFRGKTSTFTCFFFFPGLVLLLPSFGSFPWKFPEASHWIIVGLPV